MKNNLQFCSLALILFLLPFFTNGQDILITNVHIVDVEQEAILSNKDVLILDGKIESIKDHSGQFPAFQVKEIDGTGQYLIPGLWDMHVHPDREEELNLYVANGVLGIRIMWGNPTHLSWRKAIRDGKRLGPQMYLSGPIIEGTPPEAFKNVVATEGRRMVNTKEEAVAAVEDQLNAGYDFLKVYNNLPKDAYRALIRAARKKRVPVAGHIPFEVGLMEALKQKQRSIEHLRGYIQHLVPREAPQQPGVDLRSRELAWEFIDQERMVQLARKTAKSGVWNCPTLVVSRILYPQEMMDQLASQDENKYLPEETIQFFKSDRASIPWLSNFTDGDYQKVFENLKKKQQLVKVLNDAGAKILSGTDTWLAGFDLHEELKLLADSGLSNYEVLRTATLYPAQYFEIDSEYGSVQEGKRANLILLSDNPIEDIQHTRNISCILLEGQILDQTAIHRLLEEAEQ